MATVKMGQNVVGELKGGKLKIEIDTAKTFGVSKSGKSITIGTTNGTFKVTDEEGAEVCSLNVNCYKKNPEHKKD